MPIEIQSNNFKDEPNHHSDKRDIQLKLVIAVISIDLFKFVSASHWTLNLTGNTL